MKWLWFGLLGCFSAFLWGDAPEELDQKLNDAELQFQAAQKIFQPWYAGPLLTGSASMMPPGYINIQPYIFVTDTYGVFDGSRHRRKRPDLITLNPQIGSLQAGIFDWLDAILVMQALFNWRQHKFGYGFADTQFFLGIRVCKETSSWPAIKLAVGESFPTGRYNNLSSSHGGLNGTGSGSFETFLSLRMAKILFWTTKHPMNTRLVFSYGIPSSVNVKNRSVYGGGVGTRGTMALGHSIGVNLGTELSLTQKWVWATDFVFTHTDRLRFRGSPGVADDGSVAVLDAPSQDQFSIAPALEYNFTSLLGILGGVWFPVTGRNSSNFISGILTVTYTFPVTGDATLE
jgi:hypothetical protein